MKILKLFIVIFLVLSYAYAVWMTSINTKPIWGWICALIFGILALIGIHEFSHRKSKNIEEDESSN